MTWLLTGGAGYIGSHVARALLESGRQVVVLDDMSTGVRDRIPEGVPLAEGNICDPEFVAETLRTHDVTGVIHLAAKKAVGESVAEPLMYYRQNVDGIVSLLEAMQEAGVTRLVYSSSAAVYGEPDESPVLEDIPLNPISPYGQTKVIGEWIVKDVARATGELSWISLRYFNVAGAASPELADTSVANLIPIVLRAVDEGNEAQVFGDDYPTPDGTCLRDYIHVADLAEAHVVAAELTERKTVGEAINIGTGEGSSVLEVISSLSRALDNDVPYRLADRRAGDPAELVASAKKAEQTLEWTATRTLDDMTSSAVSATK